MCSLPITFNAAFTRSVHAPRGVVLAAGAWSGDFLAGQLGKAAWGAAFRPRKGLLLELPRPEGMPPVNRGMMEVGYTKVGAAA